MTFWVPTNGRAVLINFGQFIRSKVPSSVYFPQLKFNGKYTKTGIIRGPDNRPVFWLNVILGVLHPLFLLPEDNFFQVSGAIVGTKKKAIVSFYNRNYVSVFQIQ